MFLILRIVHIVTGVFWAGTLFFLVSFILPTFKAVGPDAGKVFAELRRRGLFNKLPVIALLTIVSGLWMYSIRAAGASGWGGSREGMTLGIGAVSALIAFLLGTFVMRPNTLKAADLAAEAGPMPAGPDKDAKMARVTAMRARSGMAARIVATLLGVTVIAMAIARYLV
jgi:uncharacterized membrane protein